MIILIVDDNETIRDIIANVCKKNFSDIQLIEAIHGVEAVEQVNEHIPDLVIIDQNMPFMNGIEASQIIKNLHPEIKIVLISGSIPVDDPTIIYNKYLFADVIWKPFISQEIVLAVITALGLQPAYS